MGASGCGCFSNCELWRPAGRAGLRRSSPLAWVPSFREPMPSPSTLPAGLVSVSLLCHFSLFLVSVSLCSPISASLFSTSLFSSIFPFSVLLCCTVFSLSKYSALRLPRITFHPYCLTTLTYTASHTLTRHSSPRVHASFFCLFSLSDRNGIPYRENVLSGARGL